MTSAPTRSSRLPVDGVDLAALQATPVDSVGPRVLLLAGFSGSKEDFAPILGELAAAGYHVTAIDLPGQFQSPGPADPAAYTPDALARTVHSVIDALGGGPVHLLGHSYGGLVARAAVLSDSRHAISSLVLMGSGPAAIGGARRVLLDHLESLLVTSDLEQLYDATMVLVALSPGYVALSPSAAEFERRRFLTSEPAMFRGMGDAIRTEPDRVAELAAVGRPMLVLHGIDDDAWSPQQQTEMARALGAEHEAIAGAKHSPAAQNPTATAAALIGFWRSIDSRDS